MQRRSILSLGIFVLFLAPAATATWYVNGAFEPDTLEDIRDLRMWHDADTNPSGMRVYFNAMPIDRNLREMNPNVGLLHSRIIPTGQMSMTAWLGVWKDCNADGYVGWGETGMNEYRSELINPSTICPYGGPWNRNNWVSEFIPIGNVPGPLASASWPRVIYDPTARVWGDFGRPGEGAEVHYDCVQAPFPSGTFDSTGGILLYVDCQIGYNVAKSVNSASAASGLPLAFADPYHPERDCDHPLNVQLDTFGNSYCDGGNAGMIDGNASDPAFTVWDCTSRPQGYLVDVRDPTAPPGERGSLSSVPMPVGSPFYIADESGTYGVYSQEAGDSSDDVPLRVNNTYTLAPRVANPDGSYWEGFQRATPHVAGVTNNVGLPGPCRDDYSNFGPYERNQFGAQASAPNPTDGKRVPDFNMSFAAPCCIGTVQSYPQNAGVRVGGTGQWDAGVTYLPPTYMGGTIRTSTLRPAGAIYTTIYAHVGTSLISNMHLTLREDSFGTYGFEACGADRSNKLNGWDCNPDHWHNPLYGGANSPGGSRPGSSYNFRDTDCYDGSVIDGTGIYASLALVSEELTCPPVGTPRLSDLT